MGDLNLILADQYSNAVKDGESATPSALTAGTETVYLKFRSQDDVTKGKNSEVASATNYDAKSKNSFGEIAEAVLNISNLIHIPIG